jgi:A/G-specific adenine glycosylase
MNSSETVHVWYKKNLRDLPWRQTRDPYRIWISEVILQQTRVAQGLDYYIRFADTFPDVRSLAAASEDQVLKLWQGLGYYSRARNMHQSAKALVEANGGKMPDTFEGLLAMKGVGIYTASAVASICFGEEKAVVDGNVSRVIARLYGVDDPVNSTAGKRMIETLADQLMEEARSVSPGTHNQAMMEFGALQCLPRSPLCSECPLARSCNALLTNRVDILPVKTPKSRPVKRWMYFYIITAGGQIILTRREEEGIWRSLYHFPVMESSQENSEEKILGELLEQLLPGILPTVSAVSAPIRHQLSHLTIYARFIHLKLPSLPSLLPEKFLRIPLSELEQYPVPRLIERYMEVAKI